MRRLLILDDAARLQRRARTLFGRPAGSPRQSVDAATIEELARRGFALLPQVVDAVRVPVIAAGGVADGRTVAAAFVLGASAVLMGTAFLRCEEANVPDAYRDALRRADDTCTLVTDMISGRPARLIRNTLAEDLIASGLKPLPFPVQLSVTMPLAAAGDDELMPLLAGQSVALTKDTTASKLIEAVAEETSRRFRTVGQPDR